MASNDNQLAVKLYELACKPRMKNGNVLYRNNDPKYFKKITDNNDGVMKTKLKDKNGDRKNPMNGKMYGIFFMANVSLYGGLPRKSPYGPRRLSIPIDKLLDNFQPDLEPKYKLFFNDFFCVNNNHHPHYVTVVICENGSTDCDFCEQNLMPFPEDNPFFVLADDGKSFSVSTETWVEVFYMKAINISEFGDNCYTNVNCVKPKGPVCGKPTGCVTCNIP